MKKEMSDVGAPIGFGLDDTGECICLQSTALFKQTTVIND